MFKIFYQPSVILNNDIDMYILKVNNKMTIKDIKKEISKRENIITENIKIYIYIKTDNEGLIKKKLKNKKTVGELNLIENSVLYLI